MQGFNEALGVQCTYCHVQGDFAADTNSKKEIARKMIGIRSVWATSDTIRPRRSSKAPLLSRGTAVQNGPDKRKREWFFLWFLSFIRICKKDTHARCPITVGPKRNLGRYALIEGSQLPSSAEEGTADAPASAGGGAGQEIKFCSISGRTSPTRQRPVGSQSAKL